MKKYLAIAFLPLMLFGCSSTVETEADCDPETEWYINGECKLPDEMTQSEREELLTDMLDEAMENTGMTEEELYDYLFPDN